jgi:hypothetical protein
LWKPTPYKFTEGRRHKFSKAKYRVANWPEYDAALVRRGSLTMWFTKEAVAAWHAPTTGERGGQPIYSAITIETGLALRLVFHQPLRQTEGLLRSIADVLRIDVTIPDHTTLSRRDGGLTILPKCVDRAEPLHLLVDSTGLKIYGEGEWLDQKRHSGYNHRSLAETAMYRYKTVAGRRLHARALTNQRAEAKIGCNVLNRMTTLGMPTTCSDPLICEARGKRQPAMYSCTKAPSPRKLCTHYARSTTISAAKARGSSTMPNDTEPAFASGPR